jgi:adenine-specific DNA-methyltransferase
MNGKSLNITEEKLQKLKEIFPEAFTENKIDWKKLKSTFGDEINFSDERYVLNWAGKSDAFRAIQTQTTSTLIPDKDESVNFGETGNIFIEGENLKVLKVLQKAYYGKIKMIYIDPPYNTGNDFIYNDKFAEKKNDYLLRSGEKDEEGFLTNENLYRKNSKESGHYHSNWLTMMYPRLFLARNLLRDDGVIFVSIDDNEVHNLRMIMNEIFGEENTLDRGSLIWVNKGSTKGFNKIVKNHEYILAYGRKAELVKSVYGLNFPERLEKLEHYCFNKPNPGNPDCNITFKAGCKIEGKENIAFTKKVGDEVNLEIISDEMKFENGILVNDVTLRGAFPYRNQIEQFFKNKDSNKQTFDYKGQKWLEIYFNRKGLPRYRKERKFKIISSIIDNKNIPNYGSNEIKSFFEQKEVFEFPKPTELIKHISSYFTFSNDIILDLFSGSSTTASAVLDLNKENASTGSAQVYGNRKFIMVQLPEKTDEKSEAFKAGYETIADIGKERIRRVIKKIEDEQREKLNFEENKQDLGFKVFKLQESNFKIWRGDKFETGEELEKQLLAFVNPVKEGSIEENMLYELLLKSGIDMNCKIEKIPLSLVAPERRKGGRGVDSDLSGDGVCYYLINENELVIALSKINEEIVKNIIETKPFKVITLDKLFEGSDQLKTNTILQMKDAGIEFKVV